MFYTCVEFNGEFWSIQKVDIYSRNKDIHKYNYVYN